MVAPATLVARATPRLLEQLASGMRWSRPRPLARATLALCYYNSSVRGPLAGGSGRAELLALEEQEYGDAQVALDAVVHARVVREAEPAAVEALFQRVAQEGLRESIWGGFQPPFLLP